jgi:hypothetical protein
MERMSAKNLQLEVSGASNHPKKDSFVQKIYYVLMAFALNQEICLQNVPMMKDVDLICSAQKCRQSINMFAFQNLKRGIVAITAIVVKDYIATINHMFAKCLNRNIKPAIYRKTIVKVAMIVCPIITFSPSFTSRQSVRSCQRKVKNALLNAAQDISAQKYLQINFETFL